MERVPIEDRIRSVITLSKIMERKVSALAEELGDSRLVQLVAEIQDSLELVRLALTSQEPPSSDNVISLDRARSRNGEDSGGV